MQPLTFGSLFAGIGGFDLGFERSGMVCKWQVEKNEFCREVLAKHWPDVPKYEDVKDCGKRNLESVDVICGGFPCQPFSHAGKRTGKEDDRFLWPEMFRIVQELEPAWVVGENVPGIINMALDQVLFDLEAKGYETETIIIPACSLDAPHRRDRVWILALSERIRREQRGQIERGMAEAQSFSGEHQQEDDATSRAGRTSQALCGESNGGYFMAHTISEGLEERQSIGRNLATQFTAIERSCHGIGQKQWAVEPGICRVANGVSGRVDRLRSLGNAVVPQITQIFGALIQRASNNSLHSDLKNAAQIW